MSVCVCVCVPMQSMKSASDLHADEPEVRGEGAAASAYCTSASHAIGDGSHALLPGRRFRVLGRNRVVRYGEIRERCLDGQRHAWWVVFDERPGHEVKQDLVPELRIAWEDAIPRPDLRQAVGQWATEQPDRVDPPWDQGICPACMFPSDADRCPMCDRQGDGLRRPRAGAKRRRDA